VVFRDDQVSVLDEHIKKYWDADCETRREIDKEVFASFIETWA